MFLPPDEGPSVCVWENAAGRRPLVPVDVLRGVGRVLARFDVPPILRLRSAQDQIVFLAFPLLRWLAFESATELASRRLQQDSFPTVEFVLDERVPRLGRFERDFRELNARGQLRILKQDKNKYYVVNYEARGLSGEKANFTVYEILKSNVALARITPP